MAGYRRTVFHVDEKGVIHLAFLRYITKEKQPKYDMRSIGSETAKDLYMALKEYYEKEES